MNTSKRTIESIIIGERHRRDLGDLDALADSMERQGLLQPIGVDDESRLVFGERRLRAAKDILGWTEIEARVVNVTSLVEGEHDENELRKDFTPSERVAIARAIEEAIGERRGRPKAASEERGEEKPQDFAEFRPGQETRDFAARKAGFGNRETARQAAAVVDNAVPELVEAMDAEAVSVSAAAEVAKLPKEHQAEVVADGPEAVRETAKEIREGRAPVRGTTGTGDNEWFTPAEHIERARRALGAIDLDPASNPLAQSKVQAERFLTVDDDGLAHEWSGRVWLNPPYAQPAISHFAAKVAKEYEAGRVSAAIVLTHNYTDTAWFQGLSRAAAAICFTRGRIRFEAPDGSLAAPTQGQAFFYLGQNVAGFVAEFGDCGLIVFPSQAAEARNAA